MGCEEIKTHLGGHLWPPEQKEPEQNHQVPPAARNYRKKRERIPLPAPFMYFYMCVLPSPSLI
jgi:hypothetical protein